MVCLWIARELPLAQPRSVRWECPILLRNLTLLSLFIHLVSLAATQTAYGAEFFMLRWVSLFAFTGLGALYCLTMPMSPLRLQSVNARVLIYIALWGLTVANAEYPLFSSYRWAAHAMIVVSSLIFLPQVLRVTDANKLLNALKLIVAVVLIVSYFKPAPLTIFDDPGLFRGILGNANSLGHMAAVGCLIFFHGYLTGKGTWWGYLQALLSALAALLMIRSGARSSTVAFLGAFVFIYIYYKAQLSRYVVVGVVAASVALAIAPTLPARVGEFVFKHSDESDYAKYTDTLDRLAYSRQSILEKSWKGFQERPLLGWGFGLDRDADLSHWHGELTALGSTGRDTVNDVTYALESGGVIGLFAYVLIMTLAFRAWIPWGVRSRLDAGLQRPGYEPLASAYEVQKVLFCLTVLLIVMFEFDNTALSAGNFFSALVWVSMGASIGLYASLMYILRGLAPTSGLGATAGSRAPLAA